MDPKTPAHRSAQPLQCSYTSPLPSSSITLSQQHKSPQSDEQKLLSILKALSDVKWNVNKFLSELFKSSDLPGDSTHKQTVTSILNGSSKPYMASILDAIYERSLDVAFRTTDMSVEPGTNMFNPNIELHKIQHAMPAMTTWAVRHIARVVQGESEKIVDEKAGLHLRAHAKKGGRSVANRISWEAIQHFSFKKLQEIARKNSPAMTFLLNAYTNKDFLEDEVQGRIIAIRQRRPQDLVSKD